MPPKVEYKKPGGFGYLDLGDKEDDRTDVRQKDSRDNDIIDS